MKNFVVTVLFVAMIFGAFAINAHQVHQQENAIAWWTNKHGQYIEVIDRPFFNHGPYWYQKGDHIYRAKTESEHGREITYWFRFRVWRTPAVERVEPDNTYTELDFNE